MSKAQVILKRWFHHRTRSEYRELSEDWEDENIIENDKLSLWATVPGLIVDDDEAFFSSVEDQQEAMMKAIVPRKEMIIKRSSSEDAVGHFHEVSERLERSDSFETLQTEEESDLAEYDPHAIKYPTRVTTIRWADQEGQDLEKCHSMEYQEPLNVRIVILMLNPTEKIFEFIQCEFQMDERLTVTDLLAQLPFMASMDPLKEQRYSHLYRGERELVNLLAIQDYDVDEGEILVAVAADFNPRHTIAAAAALMLQKDLVRAVQKAKLSGRALQKLMSSAEFALIDQESSHQLLRDDEDAVDHSCLLIDVTDKPLVVSSSLSSEDCNDVEQAEDNRDDVLTVEVQSLEDEDFHEFREALQMDTYSPLALGRMDKLPEYFFSEDLGAFEPHFGADGEVYTDNWGEVSSDEGSFEEIDPQSVDVDDGGSPCDVNTSKNSLLMLQKQYKNDIAFFSDLSDNSDHEEEEDDERVLQNSSMDSFVYGFMGTSQSGSLARGVSIESCDYDDDIILESDCSNVSEDLEMEPVPDMAIEYDTQDLDCNTHRDISRVPIVYSLQTKMTTSAKLARAVIEANWLNSPEDNDLEEIPEIARLVDGATETSDCHMIPEDYSQPWRQKMAEEASGAFMSAAVLFVAMDKLSSKNQEAKTRLPRDFFHEEVEV